MLELMNFFRSLWGYESVGEINHRLQDRYDYMFKECRFQIKSEECKKTDSNRLFIFHCTQHIKNCQTIGGNRT